MKDNPSGLVVQSCVGAVSAWRYEKPQTNGKMNLLTIGGVAVHGTWRGEVGEFFLAWAPLLKRDKEKEREILASRPKPGHIRVSDHVKITVKLTPAPPQHYGPTPDTACPAAHPIGNGEGSKFCGHGGMRCTYPCYGKARGHCK